MSDQYNDNLKDTVRLKGLVVSLLGSKDGTEVIKHQLKKGRSWGLGPEEGWDALEFVYITKGKMTSKKDDGDIVLQTGDHLSCSPVKEVLFFTADEDTEFIYVTSQPVFLRYSQIIRKYMGLAVEVEARDGYTADHCERIKTFAMKVGTKMNLSNPDLYILNWASFFHDIGKIKVPIEVLNKPGKLTDSEWDILKQHTTFGREILHETDNPFLIEAGKIVEQHHERWDGKGYPKGLKGEEIDIRAAIISVVDSYDAMTTDRVYRERLTEEIAIEEIKQNSGTMYNPKVVEIFLEIIENR
ncbi:HD-GYP domain-containing protein [Neobacillus niacini]|uniref:HD-GYP domain-containing protein n=1 Tax=Neobacillus niacini TaxID=86668 RepID=UPI0021CAF917|nr:HD-GYP domain-containing protein [Neobacillus niacini]MCM3766074.1 HD-GYP domain-containing protein [Neobacillus niacini]